VSPDGVPGSTLIDDGVVAAIAGHAAKRVKGIVSVGGGRVLPALAGVIRDHAARDAAGIEVEAGQKEAILDLDLVVEYGYSIPDIAGDLRSKVAGELKDYTGLDAKEINISIVEIRFPDRTPARVV
jgi:uncharacterized alkaline shock family protein YloU